MELNVREEKLRNLFKQFQVEHNENCETVFIDNNDEHLERILLIKKLQAEYMPLNKIREYILENPSKKAQENTKEIKKKITRDEGQEIYIRENVCDIF